MLSFRTKFSYGIGGICDNTLYTLVGTYLLLFLTTVAKVNPSIAGLILAVGSIWEAIVGPFFGFKSDRTITRFGKRKPYLLAAAFPIAIATSLLFTVIHATAAVKAIYYLVMIILFWTGFSMEFVPYLSWGAELTLDYNERTLLRSYAHFFNQIGMLMGMVLPTIIVDYLMNLGKSLTGAWQGVGIICGVTAGASIFICAATIHVDDKNPKQLSEIKDQDINPKLSIKEMLGEYKNIIKLKSASRLLIVSIIYLVADTFFSAGRVYYMKYNMGLDGIGITQLMLLITLSEMVFMPFLERAARKFDKKNVFIIVMGSMGILMIIMRFVADGGIYTAVLICLDYAMVNTSYWQLMPSMIYDVCQVDQLYTGKSNTGAVISLQALSESLSIAFSMQAMGIILDLSGFNENAMIQLPSASFWIFNAVTFIPGVFMIIVSILMIKYPIDRNKFQEIMNKLSEIGE